MAGQMATNAMEKVSETLSFAKKIPMLRKATSDDDNPTSGYMYQEITSITYESISSCNSLLDFLIGRLKKQSPYIKYKVLKILCYVGSNGHSEFRSALRHKAAIIRETESFTGQLDHLQGDSHNQRVRATASELIGLLFNVEGSGTSTLHAMMGPTGKRMEGFGNSPSQPAKNKTWIDSMKNLAEHLPDAASRFASKNEKESLASTRGSGITFVNYVDFSDTDSDSKTFLDDEDSTHQSEDQESIESENALSIERHLVEEITSEGGIRAVPSKQALNQFTKRCSSLNFNKVLEALNDRLLEPVNEVQLKSLHVLEHLLKSDIPCVALRMSQWCTNLQELTKTESGNVLSKATKILLLMNAKKEKERAQQDVQGLREAADGRIAGKTEYSSDEAPTLFSGMSLHSTDTTSRSTPFESHTAVPEKRPSEEILDVFQGLDLSGRSNAIKNDNASKQAFQGSKSDLDDLFAIKESTTVPTLVKNVQEPVKDSVTDMFDPLRSNNTTSLGNHVTQSWMTSTTGPRNHYSNTQASIEADQQLIGYGNSFPPSQDTTTFPVNSFNINTASPALMNLGSGSQTLNDLDGLSRNRTTQSHVTLPGSRPLVTNQQLPNQQSLNFPYNSHPIVQPSVLSGASPIPLRLPKQQGMDFSFVGKSGKADAFSFVQDEMKARK